MKPELREKSDDGDVNEELETGKEGPAENLLGFNEAAMASGGLAHMGGYQYNEESRNCTYLLVSLSGLDAATRSTMDAVTVQRLIHEMQGSLRIAVGNATIRILGAHPGAVGKQYIVCSVEGTAPNYLETIDAYPGTGRQTYRKAKIMMLHETVVETAFKRTDAYLATGGVHAEHRFLHELADGRWGKNGFMRAQQRAACPLETWEALTNIAISRGKLGSIARRTLEIRAEMEEGSGNKIWWMTAHLLATSHVGEATSVARDRGQAVGEKLREEVASIVAVN